MISQEKLQILAPLQKLPKNVQDQGKVIVAKGFKKLPKFQKIAKSGHTGHHLLHSWRDNTHLGAHIMSCIQIRQLKYTKVDF